MIYNFLAEESSTTEVWRLKVIVPAFVFVIIAVVASMLYTYLYTSPTSASLASLPALATRFVGRQQEVRDLLELLEYTADSPRIVSITGSPGFGKSTLAIHVGHMLTKEGIDVIYINMNEVTSNSVLTERIMATSEKTLSGENTTLSNLYQWSKHVNTQTLLILDNCDEQFHNNKDGLQSAIIGLVRSSLHGTFKILTTSRQQVAYIQQHHLYIIRELSPSHACELLQGVAHSLDDRMCLNISSLTGNVPLALHVVGALLNMPDTLNPQLILHELQQNLLGTLSPVELQTEDRVNASIYLSYQHLDSHIQKFGRDLSHFPGSFDIDAASHIVFPNTYSARKNLQLLVRRSLLDYRKQTNRYIYHRLIREFFKNMSTPAELEEFSMYYLEYYTSALERMAQKELIQALQYIFFDKHNLEHCFDLLRVMVQVNDMHVNKRVIETYVKLADTVGNYSKDDHFLTYGFQISELEKHIETFLYCLKQINRHVMKDYGKERFVQLYSKVVMYLIKIKQAHVRDKKVNVLVYDMIKYKWIFTKQGQFVPAQQYIDYFSMLARYYIDLNDYKMAKSCHQRVLRRTEVLGTCDGECSNLEIAKAFIFNDDYRKGSYYCDKILDSIEVSSLKTFVNAMKAADILFELHGIFLSATDHHRMDEVTTKFYEMVNEYSIELVPPALVIDHAHNIIRIIDLLHLANKSVESQKLENSLERSVKKLNEDKYINLIKLVASLLRRKNSRMVVLIGESILKSEIALDIDSWKILYYSLAQSYFLLGNHSESYKYSRAVVAIPGEIVDYLTYRSCSQLFLFASFECFLLWPGLTMHYIEAIYSNFYTYTFPDLPMVKEKQGGKHSGADDDFLNTDLTVPKTAKTEMITGNLFSKTASRSDPIVQPPSVSFYYLGVVNRLCRIGNYLLIGPCISFVYILSQILDFGFIHKSFATASNCKILLLVFVVYNILLLFTFLLIITLVLVLNNLYFLFTS